MAGQEEFAGELLWRYAELLRERGEAARLSRAELEQLVGLLETAGRVPAALAEPADEARRAAVRRRMEAAAATPPPARRPPLNFARRLRALRWVPAAALGAAVALVGATATADWWHRPAPSVRIVKVPAQVEGVEPIREEQVHALLPRMVRGELHPQEERNLMWHMLVCPGCFEEYVALKRRHEEGPRGEPDKRLSEAAAAPVRLSRAP